MRINENIHDIKKAKYLSMDYSIYQINISILLTNIQQLKYKQKDFNYQLYYIQTKFKFFYCLA